MPKADGPPEPWRSFFDELDQLIGEQVELHCFGGFVLVHQYGVARTTNDVDFISVVPHLARNKLANLAGEGSDLHKKYRVYLDPVGVAVAPENYQERLKLLFPGVWKNIALYAMEAHDLALAKLQRNAERDRDDIQRLARAGHINRETLRQRYEEELRPWLVRESWHDQTIELWIESWLEDHEGSNV